MQFNDASVVAACQTFFMLQPNPRQGAVALPAEMGLGAGSACGGAGRQLSPRYVVTVDADGAPAPVSGQPKMAGYQVDSVWYCAVPTGCFVLGRCADASCTRLYTIALCLPEVISPLRGLPHECFCGYARCGFVLRARMFTPEWAPVTPMLAAAAQAQAEWRRSDKDPYTWGRSVALKVLHIGAQQASGDSFQNEVDCMARLTPEGMLQPGPRHECLQRWQRLPATARAPEQALWAAADPVHHGQIAVRVAECEYLAMDMGGPELLIWLYRCVRRDFPFLALPSVYNDTPLKVPRWASGETPLHAWLRHLVLPVMRQLLGCLQVAHESGVAHLDLDIRNVIMRSEAPLSWGIQGGPLVSVIDWGTIMAQDMKTADFEGVKMKPPYGAPEVYKYKLCQIGWGEEVPRHGDGRAADLWSVGVIACMMVRAFYLFSRTSPGGFQRDDDMPGTARYSAHILEGERTCNNPNGAGGACATVSAIDGRHADYNGHPIPMSPSPAGHSLPVRAPGWSFLCHGQHKPGMDISYEMLHMLHQHVNGARQAYYRLMKHGRKDFSSDHILVGPAALASKIHQQCAFCRLESLGQQLPLWLILQLSALLDADPAKRLTVSSEPDVGEGAANALHALNSLAPPGADDQWYCVELLNHGADSSCGGGGSGGDVHMTD